MDNFGFPSNIKQIGNVDSNMRIYIEDNVYSYLLKYAEANKNKESLAMLVGRCMFIEGEQVLFINGAIEGKYAYTKKGLMAFSEQSLKHIEEQKETYFNGLEIVGWVISQPCFGNFLSGGYAKYHSDNFQKKYQVLFVTDPVEKVHSFFTYDKDSDDIIESGGFFIYYDKNKDMENYVANNEIKEFNIQETVKEKLDDEDDDTTEEDIAILNNEEDKKLLDKGIIKIFNVNSKGEKEDVIEPNNNEVNTKQTVNQRRNPKTKAKAVIQHKKQGDNVHISKKKLHEKALERERKRNMNIYTAVSFLLAVLSFGLGSNLIENSRKLDLINQDLNTVKNSYNQLTEYLNNQNELNLANNTVEAESVQASGTTMVLKDFDDNEEVTDTSISTASSYTNNMNYAQNQSNVNNDTQDITNNKSVIIPETYVVENGDSLLNIAHSFYGDSNKVIDIMEMNHLQNPDKIYIGMVLKMP